MKALIVDDPDHSLFAETLAKGFIGTESFSENILIITKDAPYKIAETIASNAALRVVEDDKEKEQLCVFINIEGSFGNGRRQEQKGVEILLHLRCEYKISNPIILYGFQSNQQLLKIRPEHLIINSEGCYYYQLPYDFKLLTGRVFKEVKDWNKLKIFLKPMLNVEAIKHSSANWIGMSKMLEVIKAVTETKFPENKLINSNEEDSLFKYRKSLEYILIKFIYDIENITVKAGIKNNIDTLQIEIKNFGPRILYIDDMASKGWGKLLCYSLFHAPQSPCFLLSKSLTQDNYQLIISKIIDEVKKNKIDIILLDLRLKNEPGKQDVETLGGYAILKELKTIFPGLPIIITSATNDAQTVKTLLKTGADFVWTKPGIDEQSSDVLVNRYLDFLSQIHHVLYAFSNIAIDDKIKAIEKLKWTKYRLSLYDNNFSTLNLQNIDSYTEIFIDTNFLLGETRKINLVDSISNLYRLAFLTRKNFVEYNLKKAGHPPIKIPEYDQPSVIIMNQIIDEVIKHSKSEIANMSIKAQFAFSTIMDMVVSDKIIHAEINGIYKDRSAFKLMRRLFNPKENVYADGYILDELGSYLVTNHKKFKYKDEDYFLELQNSKLLLITDDKDLMEKARAICFGRNLTIWTVNMLNNEMNIIKI